MRACLALYPPDWWSAKVYRIELLWLLPYTDPLRARPWWGRRVRFALWKSRASTEALHISPQWQSAHSETEPPREVMRLPPTVTGSVQVRDR